MAPMSPILLTLLGMSIVMIVLTMIMCIIIIMGKVLAPKTVPVAPAAPTAPSYNQAEEETLAVILAAVSNVVGTKNIGSINVKPKN